MRRFCVLALLLAVAPAWGVIIRLTSLDDLFKESTFIAEAEVEALDPDRPSVTLKVGAALKGKALFAKMPVLIKGDAGAIKRKEAPQLVERLAVKLPVVVSVSKRDEEYLALGYTNGTWFALSGQAVDGEVRWVFDHLEPYLHRTYRGTTAELIALIKDVQAGKKKFPPPDAKGKPGLGPKAPRGALEREEGGFRRGVILAPFVAGPLAVLAMLFPAFFAGWERWLALIGTVCTAATVLTLHWLFAEALAGSFLATPGAIWLQVTVVHLLGLAWAWSRHQQRVATAQAPLLPSLAEVLILAVFSVAGVAGLALARDVWKADLYSRDWWPVTAYVAGLAAAAVYAGYVTVRGPRLIPASSGESVVLLGLVGTSLWLGLLLVPRGSGVGELSGGQSGEADVRLAWTFKLPARGAVLASPLVHGGRVYVSAAHDDAFRPFGAVYCLEQTTGKLLWTFNAGKKMKQGYSSPVIAGGALYLGEGLHQDLGCKLYALDPEKGTLRGEVETESHTEATPVVTSDAIYVGSGDDGLHRVNRATLKKEWNFPAHHIDSRVTVIGDAVFGGCGEGDVFKETAVFRLDAKTGKPVWRVATEMPVWSEVAVSGGKVFAGLGHGRAADKPPAKPGGVLLCLDAERGKEAWRVKLDDGIFAPVTLDRRRVFVGTRAATFYCLSRADGRTLWSRTLGDPRSDAIIAGPVFDRPEGSEEQAERVYVLSVEGSMAALAPATGALAWSRYLGDGSTPVEVVASPGLDVSRDGDGKLVRRLYVGLTLLSAARAGEVRCYEDRTGVE
jgi:outer membrane protein assembly factor BamB